MNLAQLRTFAAVAQTGRITDAAVRLKITQSAVSHALTSLETELGVQLVVRDRTGSTLTDVGRTLLPHAETALRAVDRLADEAAEVTGLQRGRLRLGAFPTACQLLSPLIRAFGRRFPAVQIVLLEGSDTEVGEWIAARVVDLGVVTGPRDDLSTTPLAQDEMLAVFPTGHPLAEQTEVELADLADDPFLLSSGGCEPLIRGLYSAARLPFTPAHHIREMATLLAMVRDDLGVSVVPSFAVDPAPIGLVTVPLRPRVPRHLLLAAPTADQLSPAARAFLTFIDLER
ncbi:DNA-binding transcriptional LysR family regulator [Nakamurella sp. UYEF19]|uniref:LysR family transcriptional regulator n=1 Tax=Nakamurella sp. UYEF19 TaxID=1756392 RepID=UPI00339B4F42